MNEEAIKPVNSEVVEVKEDVKEDLNTGFVFVVGTTDGYIHVFSSFALPRRV